MIVFTATDEVTGKVYVGSAREDLEEHWIALVNQAEDGAEGDFFAALRLQGPDKFDIDEFGYADDSAEMRELVREAQNDLGAITIKASRSSVIVRPKAVAPKSDVDDLVNLNRESGASDWEDGADDDWAVEAKSDNQEKPQAQEPEKPKTSSLDLVKQALAEAAVGVTSKPKAKPRVAARPAAIAKPAPAKPAEPKLSSGRTGSASKEKRIKEAIAQEREAREQYRQTASTQEAAEMRDVMMAIEARRLASKKTSKTAKMAAAKKKAAAKKTSTDKKPSLLKAKKKTLSASKLDASALVQALEGKDSDAPAEKVVVSKEDSRIEAKLLAARVLSGRTKKVEKKVETKTVEKEPAAPVERSVSVERSSGGTGSAGREARIKEAIAAEKTRLQAEKRARASAEAGDMSALLARLDARTKSAGSSKR